MNAEEIKRLLTAKPFVPFRLHLSSGKHVDVMHPELAFVSKGTLYLGSPVSDPTIDVPDRVEFISMLHIVRLEPPVAA
jgi:hypothetical protein